jgi:hypothetical protein
MTPIVRIDRWVFIYFKTEIHVLPRIVGSSMGARTFTIHGYISIPNDVCSYVAFSLLRMRE